MKLSILMPVYNERTVVETCIRQVLSVPLPEQMDRELVLVDDCSTDGTFDVLKQLAAEFPEQIRLHQHEINQGKGASIRDAIQYASGDFCLIQDADLEYDPFEYPRLLKPLLDGNADAVFGSRYLVSEQTRVLFFWHSLMNKALTNLSNMFSNLNLTDMETCYKVYRTELLKSIPIRSNRFGIEPELTMKTAKRNLRVYEVPISYHGRSYEEGKKIGWKDGVKALGTILRFWIIDDLYAEPYGRGHLNNLTGTPAYLDWMTRTLKPFVGLDVLEVEGGIGNIAARLLGRRLRYLVSSDDPLYLHALHNRFLRTPHVQVERISLESPEHLNSFQSEFDTVLCVNALEYVDEPSAVVSALAGTLKPGGRLLILAPQNQGLYGKLDRVLGHKRRFSTEGIHTILTGAGLVPDRMIQFNRIGAAAWFLFGKVFGQGRIGKVFLKLFDKTVWIWRIADRIFPWNGLSLIVIARRP